MGAAALAVLLIVGVSVVAWHFTKQEPDVNSFVSLKQHGCITGLHDYWRYGGVPNCDGK